jgi:hypothetical protein
MFIGFQWKFECFIFGKEIDLIDKLNIGGNFFALMKQKLLSKRSIEEIKVCAVMSGCVQINARVPSSVLCS